MNRMRDDEVKEIVIEDELLRREAALHLTALSRKEDQKQDDVYRVSQAVRTLGRAVLSARQSVPNITLSELLKSDNFDMLVDTAKKMCQQGKTCTQCWHHNWESFDTIHSSVT